MAPIPAALVFFARISKAEHLKGNPDGGRSGWRAGVGVHPKKLQQKNVEILAWVRADFHEGVLAKVPFSRLPLKQRLERT